MVAVRDTDKILKMFLVIILVLSVSIIASFAIVMHESILVRTEHVHLKWP